MQLLQRVMAGSNLDLMVSGCRERGEREYITLHCSQVNLLRVDMSVRDPSVLTSQISFPSHSRPEKPESPD